MLRASAIFGKISEAVFSENCRPCLPSGEKLQLLQLSATAAALPTPRC
jgi:hypothetical protein